MSNPPPGGAPPGEPGRPGPEQRPSGQQGPQGTPVPGPPGQQPISGQPVAGPPWGAQPPYGQPWGPPPYGRPAPGLQDGQPPPGRPWDALPPHAPPPHAPPPRRSRRGLVAGVVVPLVLLFVAVVLARLLGDTVLDTGAVEADVAEQFEQREGVAVELTCDDEMQVERGADYECTGTTADDEEVTLRIVITDEATAAYTWDEV